MIKIVSILFYLNLHVHVLINVKFAMNEIGFSQTQLVSC